MSGPSDLARLTVTIDTANELFLSEEIKMIEVSPGVLRPTNAKVLGDLATQMSGALIYTTVALGLAGTVAGGYFSVLSATARGYVDLYQNVSGVATLRKTYPSVEIVEAVEVAGQANTAAVVKLNDLVQSFSSVAPETEIMAITDEEGGRHAILTSKRLLAPAFEILTQDTATLITDEEGAVVLYSDTQRTVLGELEVLHTDFPGVFITDPEGGLMPAGSTGPVEPAPFDDGLLFASVIATAETYDSTIYVQNLLPRRHQVDQVVATLASASNIEVQTGQRLKVSASRYGSGAVLNLRTIASPSSRKFMTLALKNVPVQTVPVSPKILMIGDSISNRQGALFLKQTLESLGFTPQFIGTMNTAGTPTGVNDITGPLGECREGWETGDYTYALNTRAIIVAPGEEAAYLALAKVDRRERNPFLRAATGADSAGIVRNGYVFDPAFYQSRFGLATPDIVINLLGTNDANKRLADSIYSDVMGNDTLMHAQIRAAWPSAKIIRSVPPTAITAARNDLWSTSYAPMLRGIKKSADDRADSKLTIAPLWAMVSTESGFAFTAGTADADGFITTDWNDAVHPITSSRLELFRALAPYVAAAALNYI